MNQFQIELVVHNILSALFIENLHQQREFWIRFYSNYFSVANRLPQGDSVTVAFWQNIEIA